MQKMHAGSFFFFGGIEPKTHTVLPIQFPKKFDAVFWLLVTGASQFDLLPWRMTGPPRTYTWRPFCIGKSSDSGATA
jgi:hypothetical protein